MFRKVVKVWIAVAVGGLFALGGTALPAEAQVTNPQSGSIGLEGTIPRNPPTVGATISSPVNGQTFTTLPITVVGLCPNDLMVKIFKNEIFSGSVMCANNSFSITIDLFAGTNQLVARVVDELDQSGPDSNTVTVTYNDEASTNDTNRRVTITSNFARKGTNPDQPLYWPISISGGTGPYAISVDWGDGNEDLLTQEFAGELTISHSYDGSGTYRIIIKATDSLGESGFLQLVGIVNGPASSTIITPTSGDDEAISASRIQYRWVIWPVYILFTFIISTFWLGRRYEVRKLKRKLAARQQINI